MKKLIFGLIALIAYSASYGLGKDPKYPVSSIPEELKKGAYAIYRLNSTEYSILGMEESVERTHQVITILNEKASDLAYLDAMYNDYMKITHFDAHVYDKDGKEVYSLKKSDINDESYISGYSLYEDDRVQWVSLGQKDYPYTIDIEYEQKFKTTYISPDWYPIHKEHISVEKAEFTINSPKNLAPNFLELNIPKGIFESQEANGSISYKWTLSKHPTIEIEAYSRGIQDVAPIVLTSPSNFSFEGYEGSLSSWDGLAEWQMKLNKGRSDISDKTANEVKALTASIPTKKEKVKAVYEYMQKRTRYVSVQLGIGGFQPIKAEVVDEVGYGDCKALVNYTQALLNSIGIKSYYTLVSAGSTYKEMNKNFPADSFNHIILAVPDEADTIWLECTSQTNPFNYMGKFTGDRNVLMITEEGGKIVRTPSYDHENNMIASNVKVELDEQGNGFTKLHTNYNGAGSEYNGLEHYLTLTDKDRKDWLHQSLHISDYELQKYDFTQTKDVIPSIDLEADIIVRKLASVSGKRIFLPLNFLDARSYVPPKTENRKRDVKFSSSSITADTITYTLPANYHVDYVPEETSIEYPFGAYEMKVEKKENQLIYYRKLTINKGIYSPETYSDVVEFFKQVRTSDNKKAVLVNKT
ncbi:DUF3857 domain-containing protein [Fulvivirga ligni]|uniref:DUF3857 domain-containing protein n=1 Tax=Fulvivirga ligni TaxID=2904246 RepID=UPI001F1F6B0E|nr:DUF3857 domain-containing protein [Fulvivirga ligni]UII22520.1 DUF3857 domain-containing protein [Fulvivirga ligni]